MHEDVLTKVDVTKTQFVITTSQDGVVVLGEKYERNGVCE